MKSVLYPLLFGVALALSGTLSAQLVFSGTDWSIGTLNLQDTTWRLFGTPSPDIPYDFYTDIALAPDGSILAPKTWLSLSGMNISESYLIRVNPENVLEGDTLFVLQHDLIGALTCDAEGNVFMAGFSLHRYNLFTGDYEYLGGNPSILMTQGMGWFEGHLYASLADLYHTDEEPPYYFYQYDTVYPFASSLVTTDFPVFTGLSKVYDYETGRFRMIGAEPRRARHNGEKDTTIIHEVFLEDTSVLSLFPLALAPGSERYIVGLTSMDEFRTNFTLQLDLDADDSGGRFIDHFQTDGLCRRAFPLADADVRIRAPQGGIDSLVVELITGVHPDGQETIHADTLPGFTLYGNGSRRLVAVGAGPLAVSAWEALVAGTALHIAGDTLATGERRVDFTLYGGGQASDGSMAFVYPQPDIIPYAGQDYSIQACPNRVIDLVAGLGQGVYRYGRWSPELRLYNTTNQSFAFYNGYTNDPGVYYYIVQEGSCGPDTAAVTVSEYPQTVFNYGGTTDDLQFIYLCPGDTAVWEVDQEHVSEWYWVPAFTTEPSRTITGHATLSLYQTDAYGCEFQFVTQFNTPTWEEEGPHTIMDTLYRCTGSFLYFFDQTVISDTTICGVYSSTSDCDLTHCRTFRFAPNEEVFETQSICEGDAYHWRGQLLTEAGTYTQLQEGTDGNCDTLATLALAVHPTFERNLVANLLPGGSFTVGDSVLTQAGTYHILLQSEHGCDSLVHVRIETMVGTDEPGAPDCTVPTLLKKGQADWRLHCSGQIGVLSCEIFDAQGRQILRRTNAPHDDTLMDSGTQSRLASGLYFYRLQLEAAGRRQTLTGRVVLLE